MTSELLKVTTVETVQVVELHIPDYLDSSEFDRLNDQVAGMITPTAGKRWVIDLLRVNYMPSSGLGLLGDIRHQVRNEQGADRCATCRRGCRGSSGRALCSAGRRHLMREDAIRRRGELLGLGLERRDAAHAAFGIAIGDVGAPPSFLDSYRG